MIGLSLHGEGLDEWLLLGGAVLLAYLVIRLRRRETEDGDQ